MQLSKNIFYSELKDYFFLTLGLLLYACSFTVFLLPYEIVTGGVTGMSAIVFYATKFPLQYTYAIINGSLLIVALKILGFRFMMKTVYAIIVLYFLLDWVQQIMPVDENGNFIKLLGEGQDFMSLVVGCCLTGTALAIVFLNNSSTGGTDIIAACVNKFYPISLGQVLMAVDVMIIGSCMLFPQFGESIERLHKVVFGLCTMFIECFVLDHVMNARRESVQFLIFSHKHEEIAEAIVKTTDHTLTYLDGHGWYTGREMKVICLLAKKYESQTIFRLIKMIDPNAFVSQSSVIGVYGEGFDQIKAKIKAMHHQSLPKRDAGEEVRQTEEREKNEDMK